MAKASQRPLATIGYETATVERFLAALRNAGVRVLADVRAVASSRRPGFSKTALANAVEAAGIDYVHFRDLGTPADGRAASRAGRPEEMRRIFLEHLATPEAHAALAALADVVSAGKKVCLLCYEDDPARCHRTIVAEELHALVPVRVEDLHA
jgi:uncharacterized protein (DUF488 family)